MNLTDIRIPTQCSCDVGVSGAFTAMCTYAYAQGLCVHTQDPVLHSPYWLRLAIELSKQCI